MNTFYKQLLIALFMSTTTFAASNTPPDQDPYEFTSGLGSGQLVKVRPVSSEARAEEKAPSQEYHAESLEFSKDTDWTTVLDQLSMRPSLTNLSFDECKRIDRWCTNDNDFFSGNPEVTHLSIKRCDLTDDSMLFYLGLAIRSLPKLFSLDLSGNRISDQGLIVLAQILKGHVHNLESVNLEGNPVTAEGQRAFLEILNS